MVSFQRMKDEVDNIGTSVTNKLPPIGKNTCITIVFATLLLLFVLGFAIGYSCSGHGHTTDFKEAKSARFISDHGGGVSSPNYVFVSNNSQSCPPLRGERLLTTMERGQSFEGLVVNLACRGDFNAFPNQIKCQRKNDYDDQLEWSHVPVCYPTVLVSKSVWTKTLHARSVSCTGDAAKTECRLTCIRDYIAVESRPYSCTEQPCPEWSLGDAWCYMCDRKCEEMHAVANPRSDALLASLGCEGSCANVIVNSDGSAAVWQNKRTGLFVFLGEHNGRPVYQNNATKEFLFYTFTGSEWLVGPDFRKPHAGIQVYGNEDTQCPERNGGRNVSRLYIDSSEPSPGGTGKWTKDETLDFQCMDPGYKPVDCDCENYKVYHLTYVNGTVPSAVEYLTGNFTKIIGREYGLLAPLYYDHVKDLYLFSHHPRGRVWQVSTKLSTTPLRGIFSEDDSCPDSANIEWEWFNTTTAAGQQLYVKDKNVVVKCLDNFG